MNTFDLCGAVFIFMGGYIAAFAIVCFVQGPTYLGYIFSGLALFLLSFGNLGWKKNSGVKK